MRKPSKRRPVRPGDNAKRMAKLARIATLIEREQARHAQKKTSLDRQATCAHQIDQDGRRKVTLARIDGDREEEALRHKQRLADLTERRRIVAWA